MITDSQGNVISRRDFKPFGEEVTPDIGARAAVMAYQPTDDNVKQKFTGYQKDEETGLDFAEARMYENRHGRFTAVDPLLASGKSANPQTFNRFVYVLNNPLILTDPKGLQAGGGAYDGAPWIPSLKALAFAVGNYDNAVRIGTGSERFSLSSYAIRLSQRNAILSDMIINPNKGTFFGNGTQVNAVRHALWQAIITKELGADIALKAGNVHEWNPKADLSVRKFEGKDAEKNLEAADQTIDLLNNQIGRRIGLNNPGLSPKAMAIKVIEYFRDFGLYTASMDQNGNVTVSQTKITDEVRDAAIVTLNLLTDLGETPEEKKRRDAEQENQRKRDEEQRRRNQARQPGKYQFQ